MIVLSTVTIRKEKNVLCAARVTVTPAHLENPGFPGQVDAELLNSIFPKRTFIATSSLGARESSSSLPSLSWGAFYPLPVGPAPLLYALPYSLVLASSFLPSPGGIVRLLYKHVNLSRRCQSVERAATAGRGLPSPPPPPPVTAALFHVSRHAAYLAFHQPRPFYATQVTRARALQSELVSLPLRRVPQRARTEMAFRHLPSASFIFFRR